MSGLRLRFARWQGDKFASDFKIALRNKLYKVPHWMNAINEAPPLHFLAKSKIPKIVFPEDKLRAEVIAKRPDLAEAVIRNLPGDNRWFKHPVDRFINKQMQYMKQGISKSEAFKKTEEDIRLEMVDRAVEISVATQQAEKLGYSNKTSHLRRQIAIKYKEAALRVRENEERERRDKIEQLLTLKRMSGDELITRYDLDNDITMDDIAKFLKLYPKEAVHFAPSLISDSGVEEFKLLNAVESEQPSTFKPMQYETIEMDEDVYPLEQDARPMPKESEEIKEYDRDELTKVGWRGQVFEEDTKKPPPPISNELLM